MPSVKNFIEISSITTLNRGGLYDFTSDWIYLEDYSTMKINKELEKITSFAYATDYAVANGVKTYSMGSNEKEDYKHKPRTNYWLRSMGGGSVDYIDSKTGQAVSTTALNADNGIRPSMRLELDMVRAVLEVKGNVLNIREVEYGDSAKTKVHLMEYGEYPKRYVGENLNLFLTQNIGSLRKTGRVWSGFRQLKDSYVVNEEYEYNGERYVYAKIKPAPSAIYEDGSTPTGINGYAWFKVEPISWRITNWDLLPKSINPNGTGEAVQLYVQTEECIMGGIPFSAKASSPEWKVSLMRSFLNNEFLKESFNTELNQLEKTTTQQEVFVDKLEPTVVVRSTRLQRMNPDTTPVHLVRKMTDTEKIATWIDAGQSVLLKGPSGIGKTARIKELYPDLIYIKLTNNMFPETVVGSVNLQTGEAIPPNFAKQAILSCATEEEKKLVKDNIQNLYNVADDIYLRSKSSDKKVVILLDELLNVKPAVQSLVYTLVLNRLVETGKGLKLPANTVVVATGNQKKYSQVAEDLAEPLEKRFDHILDMEPKVGEWIYEYAIPNKIHPSVIGYIFSKYIQSGKSEEIGDIRYFYEEPEVGEINLDKYGCRGRTNDPRGWATISNMLYSFEEGLQKGRFVGKDVEDLLKTTLASKLREEWSEEFFDFYNNPTLTVEEVVSGKYDQSSLPRDINEKFATLAGLLVADENQVQVCRNFIREHCDPEYLAVYDIYWAGNDAHRAEILSEISVLEAVNGGDFLNE